jgi:hypothetical protein
MLTGHGAFAAPVSLCPQCLPASEFLGVAMFMWQPHPEATMIMERIAETSPVPRARTTGVVYLLYFLTAVSVEVFVGHDRLVLYDAADLIAYALYVA